MTITWKETAESAYKAYSASTNNKNFRGEEMPQWAALPEAIQVAWEAAVRQIGDISAGIPLGQESKWNGWKPPK